MTDKLPPQNVEAEESILGGCLLDPGAIERIIDILTPEVFYVSAYQQIYQAMLELYRQNQPTDLLTVTNWLSDHKLLTKVGGRSQLGKFSGAFKDIAKEFDVPFLALAQINRGVAILLG